MRCITCENYLNTEDSLRTQPDGTDEEMCTSCLSKAGVLLGETEEEIDYVCIS